MNATQGRYYWLDEREGYWTKVTFDKDSVRFAIGRNHWAGVVLGSIFTSWVVGFASQTWFSSNLALFIGFSVAIVPNFLLLRSRYNRQYSHFPIVLCSDALQPSRGTIVRFSEIQSIELRENTGRCHVDDSAFAQIYIRRFDDSHLLVYQSYLSHRDKTRKVAQQISEVVGVRLEVSLELRT